MVYDIDMGNKVVKALNLYVNGELVTIYEGCDLETFFGKATIVSVGQMIVIERNAREYRYNHIQFINLCNSGVFKL